MISQKKIRGRHIMAKKILIVEDENLIALEIAMQVETLGYQIAGIFSRGEEAINQTSQLKPDLVLMDIRLKGNLDGFQTAEIIQSQAEIPVIYISALVDENMLTKAACDRKNSCYLKKPFSEAELREAIEKCLDDHRKGNYAENRFTQEYPDRRANIEL